MRGFCPSTLGMCLAFELMAHLDGRSFHGTSGTTQCRDEAWLRGARRRRPLCVGGGEERAHAGGEDVAVVHVPPLLDLMGVDAIRSILPVAPEAKAPEHEVSFPEGTGVHTILARARQRSFLGIDGVSLVQGEGGVLESVVGGFVGRCEDGGEGCQYRI